MSRLSGMYFAPLTATTTSDMNPHKRQTPEKPPLSPFAVDLAAVARSVLVQYGIGGTVGRVTPGQVPYQWRIEILGAPGVSPVTLNVLCSDRTPTHAVRSAIALQLDL